MGTQNYESNLGIHEKNCVSRPEDVYPRNLKVFLKAEGNINQYSPSY